MLAIAGLLASLLALSTSPILASPISSSSVKRQAGVQVVNTCANQGQMAMTFDDGPNVYEQGVADAFNAVGGKTTFFLNGQNWNCIYNKYQAVRDLHAQGHTLASHTWLHPDITTLSEAQFHTELEKVEEAFIKILGLRPLWFRPPYGSYNAQSLKVLSERGYTHLALWSDDSGDSSGQGVQYQKDVLSAAAANYPEGRMVLQHSTSANAIEVTEFGVDAFTKAGFDLVTADACINAGSPYVYVGEPQEPDSTWVC